MLPLRSYKLTRNVALGALIVIASVGVAIGYFGRSMTVAQLERMAENNNAALTQAIANGLWPRFADFVASARSRMPEASQLDPRALALHDEVAGLVRGTDVLKVKLYDLSGITAFSTEAKQIGADYSTNERFLGAVAGGIMSKLEFRESFKSINGPAEQRWVLSSYVPVRPGGPSGRVEGVAEIYTDVTVLHAYVQRNANLLVVLVGVGLLAAFGVLCGIVWRAERRMRRTHARNLELAAAQARAEAASHAKSVFLANMSHELRTPLNAIIGFSGMIKDAILGPIGHPTYKEYAADIHGAGEHLLRIVGDVLDLAKIEAGKMAVTVTRVELRSLVDGVLALLAPRAASAGIAISIDGPALIDIETDETKLRQILLNLLSNALKFTPSGGRVTVSLQENASRGVMDIAVTDTGVGIRAEDIPAALAPFSQVDQTLARQHEGTGLGLPLSKKFAQLLGGDLELSSTPGTGTRVLVTIPRRLTHQASRKASAA